MKKYENDAVVPRILEALAAEKPWLGEIIKDTPIKRVYLKKFNVGMCMAHSGWTEHFRQNDNKIFLCGRDGKILGQVGVKKDPDRKVKRVWPFSVWFGKVRLEKGLTWEFQENLSEAFRRLLCSDQTYFIIGLVPNVDDGRRSSSLYVTTPGDGDGSIGHTMQREIQGECDAVRAQLQ